MDSKKSVAVCVCAFLSIFLFAIIGASFMTYLYEDEKVVILSPRVLTAAGVEVVNSNNEPITELEFSESKLGLKPVTGELDVETKVPVTVTDQNGSEGIFAKFTVKNNVPVNLIVKNLEVSGNDKLELQKERLNMWFSVKELSNSTKNFEDENVVLGVIPASAEGVEYTLLFWFASVASEDFESCTISFDIEVS